MGKEKKTEKVPEKRPRGRPKDQTPGKKPKPSTGPGPGAPKNGLQTMPAMFHKVIYLKMTDPRMSNGDIAKKLGLAEKTVSDHLNCAQGKRMIGEVKDRVIDRLQDKLSELIESAVDHIPSLLEGKTKKGESLMIRADMVKFLLKPMMEKLGSEGVADEVEFAVVIQQDGTINQKMTRKRKGVEI